LEITLARFAEWICSTARFEGSSPTTKQTGGNPHDQPISVLRVAALDDQADLLRDEGKTRGKPSHRDEKHAKLFADSSKKNQEHTRWSDHLAHELQTIGDIQVSLKSVDPAISSYKSASDQLQELVDQDSENLPWKRSTGVGFAQAWGDLFLRKREWSKAIGVLSTRSVRFLQTLGGRKTIKRFCPLAPVIRCFLIG